MISNHKSETTAATQSSDADGDGGPIYHELSTDKSEAFVQEKKDFRKHLNQQARKVVKGSCHEGIRLIIHRPEAETSYQTEYCEIAFKLNPVIEETVRKMKPVLEHEISNDFRKSQTYGTRFHAEQIATPDFRYFSKKYPPQENPSLAVALRIDESASMNAFGRMEAAKNAAVAVYEFCDKLQIPLLIYGDTADRSAMEQMTMYSYIDYEKPFLNDKHCLMAISGHGEIISGHSNNRDGMALRIIAERLLKAPQKTKLLISISDGQPNALPDYFGEKAMNDMKGVIAQFSRKDILFLAAAIGQDKETICDIYGQERFVDITDLKQFPRQLIHIIAKHL